MLVVVGKTQSPLQLGLVGVGKTAVLCYEVSINLINCKLTNRSGARNDSCEEFIGVAVSTTVRGVTMHSDNRPPTLHGEDRTHMATDTQRHLSLCPRPWGQVVGQEPAAGGGFSLWWDISGSSWGRH